MTSREALVMRYFEDRYLAPDQSCLILAHRPRPRFPPVSSIRVVGDARRVRMATVRSLPPAILLLSLLAATRPAAAQEQLLAAERDKEELETSLKLPAAEGDTLDDVSY